MTVAQQHHDGMVAREVEQLVVAHVDCRPSLSHDAVVDLEGEMIGCNGNPHT